MSQDRITVAGITPPAIGKKQGKVIDTVGRSWNVWGDKLHNYQIGQTYDITYETNEFNNAKFNVIRTLRPVQGPQPGEVIPVAEPRSVIPPRQSTSIAPPQANPKDEMIFVCGVINNSLSNSNVNPFELTAAELITMVNKARQVWRNTLGNAQTRGDMDDEIPF